MDMNFRQWVQKVLPAVYDESLSYYECILKLMEVIKSTIDSITSLQLQQDELRQSFNSLVTAFEELKAYVDNLNVPEAVDAKIEQLMADGYFTDILYNMSKFNTELNFERISRVAYQTYRLNFDTDPLKRNALGAGQGMCIINGTSAIVSAINGLLYTSNVELTEIDLDTNTIMRKKTLPLGHCNSIAYNPKNDMLYIVELNIPSGGTSTPTQNILVYNYATLTFVKNVTTGVFPTALAFDLTAEKMYLQAGDDMYDYDYHDDTIELAFSFSRPFNYTRQGFAVNNGAFYVSTFLPSSILVYNNTGTLMKINSLPQFYGMYSVGEPEDLDFDEFGNIYMYTTCGLGITTHLVNQLWRCSLITSSLVDNRVDGNPEGRSTLNCSTLTLNNNPDGSLERPFNNFTEMALSMISPPVKGVCGNYNFVSGSNFSDQFIRIGTYACNIVGNNNTFMGLVGLRSPSLNATGLNFSLPTTANINYGIDIIQTGQCNLTNIKCDVLSPKTYCINLNRVNVTLEGITGSGYGTSLIGTYQSVFGGANNIMLGTTIIGGGVNHPETIVFINTEGVTNPTGILPSGVVGSLNRRGYSYIIVKGYRASPPFTSTGDVRVYLSDANYNRLFSASGLDIVLNFALNRLVDEFICGTANLNIKNGNEWTYTQIGGFIMNLNTGTVTKNITGTAPFINEIFFH